MVESIAIEAADFGAQSLERSLLLNFGFNIILFDDEEDVVVGCNVGDGDGGGDGGGEGGLVAADGHPETHEAEPQCASLYPHQPHCEQQAPFAHVVCAEHNRR